MNTQQGLTDEGKPTVATPIIIIDDDPKLCEFYKDYLEPLGYDVATAHTGPDGLEKVLQGNFSAVILDVMLPGMDGFEVLKNIRHKSDVPVLMLTGRGEVMDRVVGLEIGADDYLPKTFSTREILARLRAVTRRSSSTAATSEGEEIARKLSVGNCIFHPAREQPHWGMCP